MSQQGFAIHNAAAMSRTSTEFRLPCVSQLRLRSTVEYCSDCLLSPLFLLSHTIYRKRTYRENDQDSMHSVTDVMAVQESRTLCSVELAFPRRDSLALSLAESFRNGAHLFGRIKPVIIPWPLLLHHSLAVVGKQLPIQYCRYYFFFSPSVLPFGYSNGNATLDIMGLHI